jgi:hypothetical protein
MSNKRYNPAQIVTLLGKIEVRIAKRKTDWHALKARTPKIPGYPQY